MKNENVHMQALHCKLDVVLVQILPYNCSEMRLQLLRGFLPQQDSALYPDVDFTLRGLDPFSPPLFFCSATPVYFYYSL